MRDCNHEGTIRPLIDDWHGRGVVLLTTVPIPAGLERWCTEEMAQMQRMFTYAQLPAETPGAKPCAVEWGELL